MKMEQEKKGKMKKHGFNLSVSVFLICVVMVSQAWAQQRIGSISVVGNRSIEDKQVLSQVRSRVSDLFDRTLVDEDTKRIGSLNGVDHA